MPDLMWNYTVIWIWCKRNLMLRLLWLLLNPKTVPLSCILVDQLVNILISRKKWNYFEIEFSFTKFLYYFFLFSKVIQKVYWSVMRTWYLPWVLYSILLPLGKFVQNDFQFHEKKMIIVFLYYFLREINWLYTFFLDLVIDILVTCHWPMF